MIKKISLQNFKKFAELRSFEFGRVNLILGENGSGKSSILDAIHLLSTGKSANRLTAEQLINWESGFLKVNGLFDFDGELSLGVVFSKRDEGEKSLISKKYLVNGSSKRVYDFAGNAPAVFFSPQDIDFVDKSPSVRRDAIDSILSQASREYSFSLTRYNQGIKRRNKVLLRIREGEGKLEELWWWNELLLKHSDILTTQRADFIDQINKSNQLGEAYFDIFYDKSICSRDRFEKYQQAEIASGKTLTGPHRDDFILRQKLGGALRELSVYGSRGQQRMAVLWLKIGQFSYLNNLLGKMPILLLDDILSELDENHRLEVAKISTSAQTIITSSENISFSMFSSVDKIIL